MKKSHPKQHHQLVETAEMKIRRHIVLLVDIAVRVLEIMIVIITIGLFVFSLGGLMPQWEWGIISFKRMDLGECFFSEMEEKTNP